MTRSFVNIIKSIHVITIIAVVLLQCFIQTSGYNVNNINNNIRIELGRGIHKNSFTKKYIIHKTKDRICNHRCNHRDSLVTRLSTALTAFDSNVMEGFSEAFVGGTVGVMSVMILLEVTKVQDKQEEEFCPYCMGNGEILCATCCGNRYNNNSNSRSSSASSDSSNLCPTCSGRGLIICVNCKGDGRITPIILQSKASRDPEFMVDGVTVTAP